MKAAYIYKTNIPYVFIILMAFGAAFSSFMLSLMYPIKQASGQGIDPDIGLWIARCFMLPFIFLALACFYGIIGFKLIYLTSDELIIRRPLLMYRRRIDLTQIDRITEKEENMYSSRGLFDERKIYSGKKATILLTNGNKIKISSIQITGYTELVDKTRWRMSLARRQNLKQSF